MFDATLKDHLVIVGQLPDFVLGELDETSQRRVSRHLEVCIICRIELTSAIEILGALSAALPPPARVRGAILQRAAAERPAISRQGGVPGSSSAEPSARSTASSRHASASKGQWRTASGPVLPRWALAALPAAVLLIGALAGWTHEQRNGNAFIENDPVPSLMDESASAYPLEDSDLPVSATGVVFAEPQGHEVYLVASGLPALPRDQRYQVWLFTTNDQQQSAGLVDAGADGDLRALLDIPAPFTTYVGVALTAEPSTGSALPTSNLVLGGSFPPAVASLPSLPT